MSHVLFHVGMVWKYGDVLVIIPNQNTVVVTAVDLGSQLSIETVAEHRVQVRQQRQVKLLKTYIIVLMANRVK